MSPSSLKFSFEPSSRALMRLIFLCMIGTANGVCNVCFGQGIGCSGNSAACPWVGIVRVRLQYKALEQSETV